MDRETTKPRGRLRIGNDWNAITIIALAQSNPLKAVAEFVENSIDAGARRIQIVRGREQGPPYLLIHDDGDGVRRDADGMPDFDYVATHICDSFKRHLQHQGPAGLQGEFGIGLLSFWTLGDTLELTSAGADGRNYQMTMTRNDPNYVVSRTRTLTPVAGTELRIAPLLPGVRGFTGEKLDRYLASELRDRIRQSGVQIDIVDRRARKRFRVMPRQFDGDRLHVPAVPTANGDIDLELYLTDSGTGAVGLFRRGTRVVDDVATLDELSGVWASGRLEGIIDVPFLTLTPGTRSGVVRDGAFRTWVDTMTPVTRHLEEAVDDRRKAEQARASRRLLRSVQRALREALLVLPPEDYDWFHIRQSTASASDQQPSQRDAGLLAANGDDASGVDGTQITSDAGHAQHDFFDTPGPMHSVRITPAASVIRVDRTQTLRAVVSDAARRHITAGATLDWRILEGGGAIEPVAGAQTEFIAPGQPGLVRVEIVARQADIVCEHEAAISVTDELLPTDDERRAGKASNGLPGYSFEHASGSALRSRFDAERNLILVNNAHRDFVYASKTRALKLRYIGRLYAKELVQKNFPAASAEDKLERMIELTLYMEDHLR